MRRGITLLEVLVSILVLVLGLGGLASLLPVSIFYAAEATRYDRASTLAQGAYHDMQLRSYLEPKAWLDPSGVYAVSTASFPLSNLFSTSTGLPFLPPVVIDPLGVSYAAASGQASAPLFPAFPLPGASLPGAPPIFRLTLDSAKLWPREDPIAPVAFGVPMAYKLADRLFRSGDDLVFSPPKNSDYRPMAQATSTQAFQGDYSWLLTVSPDIDDVYQADVANMDRFTVSVVIFYKRDLNLDQNLVTLDVKAPPERMVFADLLDASAQAAGGSPIPTNFAGGSVRLRTAAGSQWLDVKPNEWLMLTGFMANAGVPITATIPANGLFKIPFCQWYRIAGVGETTQAASGGWWYRDIQLSGPDWNAASYAAPVVPFQYTAPDQPNAYPMLYQYATLATGAIAVYEYQVILDGSLLRD